MTIWFWFCFGLLAKNATVSATGFEEFRICVNKCMSKTIECGSNSCHSRTRFEISYFLP
jgi:hypothetical protein